MGCKSSGLFFWHVVRNTRRHRLLAGLNILSVALGVSVYLAIQIANHSANQSFAASIDLVAGKANLEVRSASGTFDENVLPKLAHAPGVKAATPLLEGYATLPEYPGEYLQVLGVDIFTNLPFATFAIGGQSAGDVPTWTWTVGSAIRTALAITDEFARQHGLKVGDPIRLQINGREQTLTVRFLIRLADTAAGKGNSRVAALDIGWAQELFRQAGQAFEHAAHARPPRARPRRWPATLAKLVPADVTIATPGQRSGQVERMLAGFELNLGALSLISLLVGHVSHLQHHRRERRAAAGGDRHPARDGRDRARRCRPVPRRGGVFRHDGRRARDCRRDVCSRAFSSGAKSPG